MANKYPQHPQATMPNRTRRPRPGDSRIYIPVQQQNARPAQPRHILSASQRMRAVQMNQHPYYRPAQPHTTQRSSAPQTRTALPAKARQNPTGLSKNGWFIVVGLGFITMLVFSCLAVTLGGVVIYGGGILPGVQVADIELGGMSVEEAADELTTQWQTVRLRDGDRTWQADREALGLQLDARATAERAYAQGRGEGDTLGAIFGSVDVTPIFTIDQNTLRTGLASLTAQVNIPAANAGITFENGQVRATPPSDGRQLDIDATMQRLSQNDLSAMTDGAITLVMTTVTPEVMDATPMVEAASQLLANPLRVRVYDPVTGDSVYWIRDPEEWAAWITAQPDTSSQIGLALSVDDQSIRNFLNQEAQVFDAVRFLDMDEAVAQIQEAISQNTTSTTIRVYHHDRQHVVAAGESITSIAWDYGVPYPWVQQANPGLETLSVGQTITIPSPDGFMPYPVVPDKRIVVDISEQRTRVYENGELIWDWLSSTGIADSPTWTGVYQIISHEPNAYAGNWDLWMPNFMGVYQPVPTADFTNGFHGFPTRGGGQLLWENSLGSRVTYGCILLHDDNIAQLYTWAETGVVVEIRA